MKPIRVHRQRKKGWRKPPNTKCVTRRSKVDPGRFGNPFVVTIHARDNAEAVEMFRAWIMAPEQTEYRERIRRELRGFHLACWCKPGHPCHADVLLEIANQ